MKKSILLLGCMLVGLVFTAQAQTELNTVWESTARTGADGAPSWFTAGFNRGLAMYDGQLFVADRTNSAIQVLDAKTGAEVTLETPFDLSMLAGGTYTMNDIEASDDGIIFLGNLTVNASTSAFNLYVYDAAGGDTLSTYSFTTTAEHRLGDRFAVVGSVAENTAEIWVPAASSDPGVVYQLTTADGGETWSRATLTLSGDNPSLPSNVDVVPLAAGGTDFYIAGNGSSPKRFTSDGAYVANSQFVSTSFNGSKNGFDYFEADGVEHLAVYSYRPDPVNSGNKTGYVSVYNVDDPTAPTTVFESPLMGDDVDGFSSVYGEVKATVTTDGLIFHALDGVNGLAAYTNAEPLTPANLFFSEYIEGSSNNKALEIFNPTDAEVSLNGFTIEQSSNGDDWEFYHYFPEGATIAAGDVYVIIADQVDTELFDHANADEVVSFPGPVFHNGNDARAVTFIDPIFGDTTRLDVIGDPNSDAKWDVAGVSEASGEHTLLRKPSVMEGNPTPLASFGTDEASSEWIVLDQNDFSNLGMTTPTDEPAGPVNVTFIANTSTLPDTLQTYHFLQVRGAASGPNSAGVEYGITWDAASSAVGENVGGDYWNFEFEMSPGDTLNYKLFAGFDADNGAYNGSETGWESGDNRQVILPEDFAGDTTLALWYETRTNPFEDKTDSVGIKFRVNMGAQAQTGDFDPEADQVGVRGSVNDWGDSFLVLEEEDPAGAGDNLFYSGILYVPDTLEAGEAGEFAYKFVYVGESVNWESGDDKVGPLTKQDTTFQWKFFNNRRPTNAQIIDHTLQFEVDLAVLTGLGFFTSGYDSVYVRGSMNAWGKAEDYLMTPAGVGSKYQLTNTVTEAVGATANYKYYVQYPDARFDETSENYFSGVDILEPNEQEDLGYEEPGVTGGGNRQYVFDDNEDPKLVGAHFFNGVPFAGLLADFNVDGGATEVTFSVDMTNATNSDVNEGTLFNPASDSVWVYFETKYFAFTQGLPPGTIGGNAEAAEKVRMTDEDGDMVYELTMALNLPTINHIGFNVGYGSAFTATGEVVRNGGGFDAGRRYYQYLQPTSTFIIDDDGEEFLAGQYSASYELPTLDWVAGDLPYENMPNYDDLSSEDNTSLNPDKFALEQNYPNPFNPATTINFSLANTSNVKLAVYNILGQRVATLINGRQLAAGTHTLSFDASKLASGTYIYRIEAGDFTSTKKMTLIK